MSADCEPNSADAVFLEQASVLGLSDKERNSGLGVLRWFSMMHAQMDTRHHAVHQALLPGTLQVDGGIMPQDHISIPFARALLITLARCAPVSFNHWKRQAREGDWDIDVHDVRVRRLRTVSRGIKLPSK